MQKGEPALLLDPLPELGDPLLLLLLLEQGLTGLHQIAVAESEGLLSLLYLRTDRFPGTAGRSGIADLLQRQTAETEQQAGQGTG